MVDYINQTGNNEPIAGVITMTNKPLTMTTTVRFSRNRCWFVKFTYLNKVSIEVTAKELYTDKLLKCPNDAEKIQQIIPLDMWPAFAVPTADPNWGSIPQVEGLF